MNTYETSATVEEQGRVQLVGLPFAAGTQVQVTISSKQLAGEDFATAWRRVCGELRSPPGLRNLTDEHIREEIDRYRAGH